NRWICQGRGIAQSLALGDIAQQAAHDLSRSRLWQIRGKENVVRASNGANLLDDVFLQIVDEGLEIVGGAVRLRTYFVSHGVRDHGWRVAWTAAGGPSHGPSGRAGIIRERALALQRPQPVAADVNDINDASEQPEIPLLGAFGAVSGHIHATPPLVPVLSDV